MLSGCRVLPCTAAGSDREILFAFQGSLLLLIRARYRMLESGRVGGVSCDGNVYASRDA